MPKVSNAMSYEIFNLSNVFSLIALLISIASFYYVWKKDNREVYLIKLKQDKSILYPLLQENYDYFLNKSTDYDTEKLEYTIKLLKIDNLHNLNIKDRIIKLRSKEIVFIKDEGIMRTINGDLENLFIEIRYYLSEII